MNKRIPVQNTGTKAGDEVVQLYVQHQGSKVTRPMKELKRFQRVTLQPGEKKTVNITLKAQDLAYWDAKAHTFIVEADQVKLLVGNSSDNLKLEQKIKIVD